MRPLILTGGPAAGKSTCARTIGTRRERCAVIDGDDIRQMVVSGARTLWSGAEGEAQMRLSTHHVAGLGRSFDSAGFDVVIADVVTEDTLDIYRRELPGCCVIHLRISLDGARERALTRPVHLTDEEFVWLHDLVRISLPVDAVLEVDGLTTEQQVEEILRVWRSPASMPHPGRPVP